MFYEQYIFIKKWNRIRKSSQVSSTSNSKMMILSKCAICGSKKSKFIKKHDAKGLLSNLGIKTLLSKIPVLCDILF